jgi:DNA polymerase-3 subunit alpha
MNEAMASAREKSQWEKELLGVSLSRASFAASSREPGMLWPSEIDAEMDGQSVAVVGEIAAVTQLFTRERKPFVKAVIEDISGSIETMVWPRVYDADRGLWQEGNTVVVEGKVRVKDDALQLNCDRARVFVARGAAAGEEGAGPKPPGETPGEKTAANGRNGRNGNGANGKAVAGPSPAPASPPSRRRVVISLGGTDDRDSDVARLHKVVDTLKQFVGEDEVSLCLTTEGQTTNLKLTGVGTNYCRALHEMVAGLVGDEGVRVETIG